MKLIAYVHKSTLFMADGKPFDFSANWIDKMPFHTVLPEKSTWQGTISGDWNVLREIGDPPDGKNKEEKSERKWER